MKLISAKTAKFMLQTCITQIECTKNLWSMRLAQSAHINELNSLKSEIEVFTKLKHELEDYLNQPLTMDLLLSTEYQNLFELEIDNHQEDETLIGFRYHQNFYQITWNEPVRGDRRVWKYKTILELLKLQDEILLSALNSLARI